MIIVSVRVMGVCYGKECNLGIRFMEMVAVRVIPMVMVKVKE